MLIVEAFEVLALGVGPATACPLCVPVRITARIVERLPTPCQLTPPRDTNLTSTPFTFHPSLRSSME